MRIDLLKSETLSTGDTLSVDLNQSKVTGLIVTGSISNSLTTITVKVREDKNTHVLANRLSFGFIGSLTDQDYGMRTKTDSIVDVMDALQTDLAEEVTATTINEIERAGAYLPMVYLPLGHLSLSSRKELDVLVNYGNAADADVRVYSVHLQEAPDYMLLYDVVNRTTESLDKVRRIFIDTGTGIIDDDTKSISSIDVQLDVDDEKTYLFDAQGMLAAHSLFGRSETTMEDRYLEIFDASLSALPSHVRVKMSNYGALSPQIIFIREIMTDSTSRSTLSNLDDLIRRVEKLEKHDPESAKAYRHAGYIPKAEDLKEAKAQVGG